MTNNLLESLRKKLYFSLDKFKNKFIIFKKLKRNNKIIINKDNKDNKDNKNNIPKHLRELNKETLQTLQELYKEKM